MLYLVDMSNNNGFGHDFVKAKKEGGIAGAIFKCTEGVGFIDRTFETNWSAAKKAGLVVGAYHFADTPINNPIAEANFFLNHRPTLHIGDMLILDMERAIGGYTAEWAFEWLEHVQKSVGFPPLLYTGLWFAQEYLQDERLAQYPLWLADWGQSLPHSVPPWDTVALWQFSSNSSVPGIVGLVDKSCLERTVVGLKSLGKRTI